MRSRRLAVHRTIVVVDVVGFGDQCRTNAHQVTVRDGMYQVMSEAFDRVGISDWMTAIARTAVMAC